MITELNDEGCPTDVIFLDFENVFDSVPKSISTQKSHANLINSVCSLTIMGNS